MEPKVYISLFCIRSGRKKIPEAALRLEDHLLRFRSISELNQTLPHPMSKVGEEGC